MISIKNTSGSYNMKKIDSLMGDNSVILIQPPTRKHLDHNNIKKID